MSKIKVQFFAADPLSHPRRGAQRLMLDEEAREIQEKVRSAQHRDRVEFHTCWATRTSDLLLALNRTPPHVVHFSGHGGSEGLVLVSADGRDPHPVPAGALTQLFKTFHGEIRVVVLNACYSAPQAEAIAGVIGCAIGTRNTISDVAAITFAAAFYRAIAFGHSVAAAYEQGKTALHLEHFDDRDCPVLLTRPDVDPAQLYLVPNAAKPGPVLESGPQTEVVRPLAGSLGHPRTGRARKWAVVAGTVATLGAAAVLARNVDRTSAGEKMRTFGAIPASDSTPRESMDWEEAENLYNAGQYAAAFPTIQRAAKAGNPEAMGILGIMYLKGQGTARQVELGVDWLKKAVDRRDARGMNARGEAFEEGNGFRVTYHLALHWYRAAATEKEYVPAMINLGDLHREGLGTAINYDSALTWYRKAIDAGSPEAMVAAGRVYEEGSAGVRDLGRALRLYRTAADSGSPLGMYAMGRAHQQGVVVPRDYAQSRAWYLRGAEAGSAEAMNGMGELYQNGWGVPADRNEAIRWYRRAAAAGSAVAQSSLAALQAR